MKKVIIACAAVLALGLTSCGDTKMCYKVSAKNAKGKEITTYMYGTSTDIDAGIEQWKKANALIFGDDEGIKITRSKLSNMKSEEDCKGASINL